MNAIEDIDIISKFLLPIEKQSIYLNIIDINKKYKWQHCERNIIKLTGSSNALESTRPKTNSAQTMLIFFPENENR